MGGGATVLSMGNYDVGYKHIYDFDAGFLLSGCVWGARDEAVPCFLRLTKVPSSRQQKNRTVHKGLFMKSTKVVLCFNIMTTSHHQIVNGAN